MARISSVLVPVIFAVVFIVHCEGYRRGQWQQRNGIPESKEADTNQESPFT